jgi:hypothetical protein
MRLSTALKPRIISCTEETETYIAIPRGCLEDIVSLCETNRISFVVDDRRSLRHKISGKDNLQMEIRKSLVTRYTDFNCPWSEEDKIHGLWPFLIKDDERDQMIVNDIVNAMREKRSPIILTERKEHLEILRQSLRIP